MLYCEPGSPSEVFLQHCKPGPTCGEGRCILIPKGVVHLPHRGLQVKSLLNAETMGTYRERQLCLPAVRLP
jgi:hypothetical protein